ncbi:eukaryotic mitochondrial regulator protein-domain-containing protein [Neurospora tetraspora]|uniref:Eukaryotic mitochondrial regulator protein-domain-containing protein n=1 Tax=Neurospora tetraspora TaxID=94610 RepID=A0AAE0JMS1_9PEZI|nr:eukaryotic mitochondrial regulator protein-domain-containing protein [Neurospora tetraspora]
MPPRIPNAPSSLLLQSSACSGSSSRCTASRLPTWASSCSSSSPQSSQPTTHQQQCSSFSTTAPALVQSVRRQKMFAWLDKKGSQYKEHTRQGPNLLGSKGRDGLDVPFPNNPYFKSQPVLSEGSREIIYKDVMELGLPIKAVSAKYNVDVRRVAAVIRLKEIEKRWIKEYKPLARPYARAVMKMLPQTVLGGPDQKPHESINDVYVHSYTTQQLFVPVSESREFTRQDAAKAFGDHILPVDKKLRVPELIEFQKDLLKEVPLQEANQKFLKATAASEARIAEAEAKRRQAAEDAITRVKTDRFEFRFQEFNAENVGHDGRDRNAVGWRYGVPFHDRKRSQVKIPTKVE